MGIRQLDTVRKVNGARAAGAAAARISGLNELQVRLPASCSKCSCVIALISRENNGHSLRCASCGAPLGRVSNAAERFLQKFVELFGRPTKPVEIHHNSKTELSLPPSGAAADDSHDIIAPEKEVK
jgi:hypothetical protein